MENKEENERELYIGRKGERGRREREREGEGEGDGDGDGEEDGGGDGDGGDGEKSDEWWIAVKDAANYAKGNVGYKNYIAHKFGNKVYDALFTETNNAEYENRPTKTETYKHAQIAAANPGVPTFPPIGWEIGPPTKTVEEVGKCYGDNTITPAMTYTVPRDLKDFAVGKTVLCDGNKTGGLSIFGNNGKQEKKQAKAQAKADKELEEKKKKNYVFHIHQVTLDDNGKEQITYEEKGEGKVVEKYWTFEGSPGELEEYREMWKKHIEKAEGQKFVTQLHKYNHVYEYFLATLKVNPPYFVPRISGGEAGRLARAEEVPLEIRRRGFYVYLDGQFLSIEDGLKRITDRARADSEVKGGAIITTWDNERVGIIEKINEEKKHTKEDWVKNALEQAKTTINNKKGYLSEEDLGEQVSQIKQKFLTSELRATYIPQLERYKTSYPDQKELSDLLDEYLQFVREFNTKMYIADEDGYVDNFHKNLEDYEDKLKEKLHEIEHTGAYLVRLNPDSEFPRAPAGVDYVPIPYTRGNVCEIFMDRVKYTTSRRETGLNESGVAGQTSDETVANFAPDPVKAKGGTLGFDQVMNGKKAVFVVADKDGENLDFVACVGLGGGGGDIEGYVGELFSPEAGKMTRVDAEKEKDKLIQALEKVKKKIIDKDLNVKYQEKIYELKRPTSIQKELDILEELKKDKTPYEDLLMYIDLGEYKRRLKEEEAKRKKEEEEAKRKKEEEEAKRKKDDKTVTETGDTLEGGQGDKTMQMLRDGGAPAPFALRESESAYLFAVQAGRAVYYIRTYCTRGTPTPRDLAWDFVGSVGAVWVTWAAGLLTESAVSRALAAVLASWAAVVAFWGASSLARADPGFRVAASVTVVLLVSPLFFSR